MSKDRERDEERKSSMRKAIYTTTNFKMSRVYLIQDTGINSGYEGIRAIFRIYEE